jgi:long-chain-fatty-acid--CoA ligase ACSBG
MMAATIPSGLYSTNSAQSCQYLSHHSKAKVVVIEAKDQLKKYKLIHSQLPDLKAIVVWGEFNHRQKEEFTIPVYSWDEFMNIGTAAHVPDQDIHSRIHYLQPGHCATLIYTSGTTGPPKGAMLSHDNIAWTCRVFANNFVEDGVFPGRVVSYLPLSHIAAQMIDIQYPLYSGACTYFAQHDCLKGSLTNTLKEIQPTVFFAVPRVWEKMQEKLQEIAQKTTGLKKSISTWAKSRASWHCNYAQYDSPCKGALPWGYHIANHLVLSKIKEALGFTHCLAFYTAAAPIARDTLEYFASLDIPVLELFGQTECTGPHCSSKLAAWKIGACGRPLPGTRTKIESESGELRFSGRHVFLGYIYMPEQTAAHFDSEGYFKSGDIASIDHDNDPDIPSPSGFISITGRIKDLIITAGGENIPPLLIEEHINKYIPVISNCVVLGDRRKYLSVIMTLKTIIDTETGLSTGQLHPHVLQICENLNSSSQTIHEFMNDEIMMNYIQKQMEIVNHEATSRAQRIQRWKILPIEFSEQNGELTPTLKIKRNVVIQKYSEVIESMYLDKERL